MKKTFGIVSHKKIKNENSWNGYKAHNERKTSPKNVDKSRSHLNMVLKPNSYKNLEHFIEKKREYIRKKNKENGTKNRCVRKKKNKKTNVFEYPSVAQEFVFTYSNGALTDAQGIEYLKLAERFMTEWYGSQIELLQSVIHLDEKTPHIHIDFAYFDLEQGKFCQKELQAHGKTDITAIREAWDKYLQDTDFAHLKMQDGSVVASGEHVDKASLEIDALKKEIVELKEELAFYKNPKSDDRADLRGLAKHYHDRDTKEGLRAKLDSGEITEAEHTKELIALTKAKVKGKGKSRAPKPQKKR